MKLLILYSCLLAILLQAISASSLDDGSGATLKSKKSDRLKAKKVASGLAKEKAPVKASKEEGAGNDSVVPKEDKPKSLSELLSKKAVNAVIGYFIDDVYFPLVSTQNWPFKHEPLSPLDMAKLKSEESSGSTAKPVVSELVVRRKLQRKRDKTSIVPKEDRPRSLSEILLKPLVEIVIGYLNDSYPILVSTHDWLFKNEPRIEVDGARVYVMSNYEGLKGLNHSLANLKDERRYIEFGDPRCSIYYFSSSHDGRRVYFYHLSDDISTDYGKWTEFSAKLFTQGNERESGKPKRILFDGEEVSGEGLLSRDGKVLFSLSRIANVTRVYQIKEEAGKDHTASLRLKLNGKLQAVSGNGKRVMVSNAEKLEIHSITDKDTSELICQIDVALSLYKECALNEDGSEAAFVKAGKLRIMKVNDVVGDKIDQSAIVTFNDPELSNLIVRLVYSDSGELHVLRRGGKVSLFDPSENTLIPIETPQERQDIFGWAISPNANYIATLHRIPKEDEGDGRLAFRTVVKRKLERADL